MPLFLEMQQECKLECTSNSCDYMTSLQQMLYCGGCDAYFLQLLLSATIPTFFRPIKGNGMDKDSRVNQILHTTSSKSQRKFEKLYFPLNFQESHYFPLSNLRGDEKTTFCRKGNASLNAALMHYITTKPSHPRVINVSGCFTYV